MSHIRIWLEANNPYMDQFIQSHAHKVEFQDFKKSILIIDILQNIIIK